MSVEFVPGAGQLSGIPRQAAAVDHAARALRLQGIGRRFGGLEALRDVTLSVAPGERWAVLGPNGAGKTTLFNLIAGEVRPTSGSIWLFGEDVTRLPPHARVRRGLTRTYQTPRVFAGLTVEDNLFLAVRGVAPRRMSLRRPGRDDPAYATARRWAERVGLGPLCRVRAGSLAHGQRRQLEVGMALAGRPRLLMLDEPVAGLAPGERQAMTELLRGLDPAITVILIEHDMDVALRVAERVVVLHQGRVIAQGTPGEVMASRTVQEVYLGAHG